jgi:hypothetical protein
MCRRTLLAALAGALVIAPAAHADGWLPHPKDASWTYEWTDSVYNTTPTKELVTVKEDKGRSFVLSWTTIDQGNAQDAPTSLGLVAFQESAGGLINTDWSSTPTPPSFPILCPRLGLCNNSLASTYYNVIWGSRAPVLSAPLVRGATWSSTGGAEGDVSSTSLYMGVERVSVPAFPEPVLAAKVRSDITQAGALGDPYGSGVRTVWWVYGVGPVQIVFEHAGSDSPQTTSVLVRTNQVIIPLPPDANYFPLTLGKKLRYGWTNTKHMKKRSVQDFVVDQAQNGSARFTVKHVSGPIRVAGAYGFTARGDGVTNVWASTQSASLARFPRLGPSALPQNSRRRFVTPFDLMIFGFNPILPAYPEGGAEWAAKIPSRDFSIFGVSGSTTIAGVQPVKVRAGRFRALVVQTKLEQKGFPFGTGTRTSWFAPGKGLVKLVFSHADGSVSTVELIR